MWHRVAPVLADHFIVVAADLRGFGDSGAPPSTPDHAPYAMRAIALDQVEVMRTFGYEHFAVVGHDRGARCAYRLALDHPQAVTRLAVLDIVPTGDSYNRADKDFALGFWVWSFLAAPEPLPEQMIAAAPDTFVNHMLDGWSDIAGAFPDEVRAEYIAKFRDPATVHAICEEYRAAATLDHAHDEADRGVRRITCPTLALWSSTGAVANWYDPLEGVARLGRRCERRPHRRRALHPRGSPRRDGACPGRLLVLAARPLIAVLGATLTGLALWAVSGTCGAAKNTRQRRV
jgi:haloacetate dehalogenase